LFDLTTTNFAIVGKYVGRWILFRPETGHQKLSIGANYSYF